MAANLEIVNGKASMFYALDRGVPWHKEGTSVETAVGYEEALEKAGIDWEVELRKIRLVDGAGIPTRRAVVRKTDSKTLGVVGLDYRPIQNREVFDFMDSLYQDGQLLYDTAGALNGGATVWMLARMTEDMRIGNDTFANYLLATTSHDATASAAFYATKVRVVCENTLNLATGKRAMTLIRHKGDISMKLEKARAVLSITNEQHRRLEAFLRKADEVEVTEPMFAKVEEKLFGTLDDATPTMRRNAIDAFRAIYKEEVDRNGTTAYSLTNAVTGYGDHKIRTTKDGTRMGSMLVGSAAMFKKDGMRAVQQLVASV